MAEPGFKIDDIAQIAWHCVPLARPELCHHCGISAGPAQTRRLAILCDICGVSRTEVITALRSFQTKERERTLRLAEDGLEPWVTFHARGDVATIESDQRWLGEHWRRL